MASSFAEVPLLYPCQGPARKRFVIHDEAKSFERDTAPRSSNKNAGPASEERLPGSASASSLGGDAVMTTCALVDEPAILLVSLVQGTSSPLTVELDLGQTKVFGVPVKIQCFQEGASFLLRLVDSRGVILSVKLDSLLTPDALALLSVPRLVEAEQGFFSGAELDASMVTFLSSTVLVVGLAPNLMAVNVVAETIDIWSEEQTLEEMKSRRLGHIFSRASDLILGRTEDDDNVDMPPIAAVCQAGGEYVFSLHSDASIRRWRVHQLHPTEVVPLKLAHDAIPAPEMWSDSSGAVALCAQLYTSVYALVIHVQTVGGDEDKSACQLIVVHGTLDLEEGGDLVRSALPLSVPSTATSLVGIALASERCRLTALYQSQENDMDSTLIVTYPPSVVSIVSSEPIITPKENTLNGVAAAERSRLTTLTFPVNGASLEENLHSVDTNFLKYLFRPSFPRGTGVVTPLSCVRAAIRKLVPGHYAGKDMSIELETLRAMNEWRRLDNRSVASPARRPETTTNVVATPGGSVYDTYARHDPDGTPEMDVDDSYMEDEEDVLSQERAAQVESHQQRWRELLLAVWAEEERMLDLLCVSNLLSTQKSNFVLVRAGVTSLLKEVDPLDNTASTWEELDRNALILLGRIENSEEGLAKLNSMQTRVHKEIAKASLVLTMNTMGECAIELSGVGSEALSQADEDEINPEGLVVALRDASVEDTIDWLQSIDSLFSLGMPGASVLPDSADVLGDEPEQTWKNHIADVQTRLAASSLFVQCTDSVRRLTLARFLLLTSLDSAAVSFKDSLVSQAAFREYLYSISVLWTCAQQVPIPSAVILGRNKNIEFGKPNFASSPSDSPPTKRTSFGDTTSSILAGCGFGSTSVTTSLDAHFIQISQEHSQSLLETGSLDGRITTMARICLNSTFAAALSSTLPELGVLPTPSDESVASDYPRLALRLIAPFYADPPRNQDENMRLARKETLAECLLIEANAEAQKGPSTDSLVNALQSKVCDLLAPPSNDASPPTEHKLLETVFVTLQKQSQSMLEPDIDEIDRNEKALATELQLLLTGIDGQPGIEITRLCLQPTVRSIFLPLMATERKSFFRSLEELSRASVKSLTEVLLRISKLMHRLSLLERHTSSAGLFGWSESSGPIDFLLGYIEETIAEFQTLLPKLVYESMEEYATLWSLLFNHSVSSRRWRTAHSVCVYHPIPERRVENYKRLVIAMANAGASLELTDLCAMVSCSSETIYSHGACVDFYEIAAETLAEARQGNPYEAGSISTDYLGCLYSLHASRGHWARAAEAMDAKYTMALKAVSSSINSNASLASMMNVNAAADDMVLASLFAANAVQLIDDPSKRFLVSGEVGPFPSLPISVEEVEPIEMLSLSNKRGRNDLGWTSPHRNEITRTKESSGGKSRLSRFMTVADLNARAARAIASCIFLRDGNGNMTNSQFSTIEAPTAESDNAFIDRLASLGYYEHAILVAKAIDKQLTERTCGAALGGRGLLHDAIMQVLAYLMPVALNPLSHQSNDSMETDNEMSRPVFSQLTRAIEETDVTSDTVFSFVLGETWCPRAELPAVATATAAMELIRKLTTKHSSTSSPIALEVASIFLDVDSSSASLPVWLERLIMGIKTEDSSGLFARKTGRGFSGDPSSLVGLYMKRGMFSKACDIVSTVLSGNGAQLREARAPARLPEKGDIDFVPYEQIDTLWSLVDGAVSNPTVDAFEKRKLEESRKTIERALEKHFELMKISEQGMRSARALTQ